MKQGKIIKSTGSWFVVRLDDKSIVNCTLKGGFRLDKMRSTNPVAVGDTVTILKNEDGTGVITKIDERKNYIIRRSTFLNNKTHIVAANIDQAILVVTLKEPRTSTGFIDRFLVTAEAYGVPITIVFNKIDLYKAKEKQLLSDLISLYTSIGYNCLSVSVKKKEGKDLLLNLLSKKENLISGHSGVGKSSLINWIIPGLDLRTNIISTAHNKGMHTTTFAEMFEIPEIEGFIVDTPGIKGFGLVDIEKEELSHYFPEMRALLNKCKFHNCKHINEPNCAVKDAVENGLIAMSRFENYLNMYSSDEDFS